MDWGFIVQKSKNYLRTQGLTSIDGNKSYLLVYDHYDGKLFGVFSDINWPPLKWFNRLLTQFEYLYKMDRYACMDLGSELIINDYLAKLLDKHG